MKHSLVLLLIGLIAFGAAPAYGIGDPNAFVASNTTSLDRVVGNVSLESGPSRDPAGEDWISYCDDPSVYWSTGNVSQIWTRTRFTAPSAFTLQAISAAPSNPNNVNAAFKLYVYRENGNNLGQRVFALELNNGLPQGGPWYDFEFNENQYVNIQEGETFSVVYGPCPGQSPANGGRGYWPQSDGAGNFRNRSYLYLGAAPSNTHGDWTDVVATLNGGDLCVKANGTLQRFTDLAVGAVYNSAVADIPIGGRFIIQAGEEQTYRCNLKNVGSSDVAVAIVTFSCKDSDDNEVWVRDVITDAIAAHDSLQVECDTTFIVDQPGKYNIWVTAVAESDANGDNDIGGLEQTFWDPVGNPEEFVGYTDGVVESSIGGDGFGAAFPKPADEFVYKLLGFRVLVFPTADGVQDVPVAVGIFDPTNQAYQLVFLDTLQTDGSADSQFVTVDLREALPDSAQISISGETEMFAVLACASNGVRIGVDGTPPSAGTNSFMPSVMWTTTSDFSRVGPSASADYAVEAQIAVSDEPPSGHLLRILPDTLEFGNALSRGEAHTIEAMFISYGADSVRVTSITVPPGARNYIHLSQSAFAMASRETTFVSITFYRNDEADLSSQLLVNSSWDNHRQYMWRLHASTVGGIFVSVENTKPGIPEAFNLSQNFPNPFNPTTTIDFALPMSSEVSFVVFDVNGRQVGESIAKHFGAGYHSFNVDASSLPAGVYAYKLTAGDFSSTKKMVLTK